MKWLLALLGVLLAVATLTFGIQIGNLRGQFGTQQHQARQDQAQLAALRAAEFRMASQLASLTQPTDPLAAYNAVCNFLGSDGVTTWYYPCTNQAQTIPQPSGG